MSIQRVRTVLAVMAAAAALAACATPAPPPPPPPPPPAAPPIPPPITLSTAIVQDAAVYQDYLAQAASINPNFTSGADVAQALIKGESISPEQLLRGEIAYAAIAALQDPNYVANVRAFAGDPTVRQQMLSQIIGNPGYAVAFKGSDTAAGLAAAALAPGGDKMFLTGAAVRQAAYDVQHQAWSKDAVDDRPGRLARAKNAALVNAVSALAEVSALHADAVEETPEPLHAPAAAPPYPPVVVRGLAVAALAALGEAGDDNLLTLAPLFQDAQTATCLNTARLNLYQCLAVARPHYEDIFCLGQHALMDSAQCLLIAAGAATPQVPAPPPPPPPAAKPHKARRHAKKG